MAKKQHARSFAAIVAEARSELGTPRLATMIGKRRQKVLDLVAALEGLSKRDQPLRVRSRGAVLTINEGQVVRGKGTKLILSVEILGANVGSVTFSKTEARLTWNKSFGTKWVPGQLQSPDLVSAWERWRTICEVCPAVAWSRNPADGKVINSALAVAAQIQSAAQNQQTERLIQMSLVRALVDRKSRGRLGAAFTGQPYEELRGFAPVRIAGVPMEVGTVLKSAALSVDDPRRGTGQADILVRQVRGRSTKFLAFELKAPDGEGPEKALEQAIRYAVSLDAESNGLEGAVDSQVQLAYHRLFGSSGSGRLIFGAVAVVDEKHEAAAAAAYDALGPHPSMRVGVLTYRVGSTKLSTRTPLAADGIKFLVRPNP